jgi:hypothetical protein
MKSITGAISLLFLGCFPALAYTNLRNNLYLSDGSVADTQNALKAVPTGSTVLIPNGSYTWSSPISINTDVNLKGESVGGVTITNNYDSGNLITVNSRTPFAVTISALKFIEGSRLTSRSGITLYVNRPILLHDSDFETNGHLLRSITWGCNGGVIWGCSFYSHDQDDGAIAFQNAAGSANGVSPDWSSSDTFGTLDVNGTRNTYVEDCTFTDIYLQALDFSDNSRTVVRHCRFNNSAIASHGLDTGPYGVRQWEVYNNEFIFSTSGTSPAGRSYPLPMDYWFFVRGGTGVFWGNKIPDMISQQWGTKSTLKLTVFNIRRPSAYIPCQTTWPAIHQVGQGYNQGLVVDPVYIWGNAGGRNYDNPGIIDWQPDQCGHGQFSEKYIKPNRDYFTGVAKPGYAEYAYPHPLRSSALSVPAPRSAISGASVTHGRNRIVHPTSHQSGKP